MVRSRARDDDDDDDDDERDDVDARARVADGRRGTDARERADDGRGSRFPRDARAATRADATRGTRETARTSTREDDGDDARVDDGDDGDAGRARRDARRRTVMRAKTRARFDDDERGEETLADFAFGRDVATRECVPDFVKRPVDAWGRARGRGGLDAAMYRLSNAMDDGRFDPSSLRIEDGDFSKINGEFAKQFWRIKMQLMDCVVMVKHGSFYNMFDVDADAGKAVGLQQTGTNSGFMRKVGCRAESFDTWAARLLARGYTVARVEQMSEAARETSVMKRECCEILTPSLDRGLTNNERANFFITIAGSSVKSLHSCDYLGVCAVDADSGTAALGVVTPQDLHTVLVQYEPREVVISEQLSDDARKMLVSYVREGGDATDCVLRVIERGKVKNPSIERSNILNWFKYHTDEPVSNILQEATEAELRAVGFAMRHLAWCGVLQDVFSRTKFMSIVSVEPRRTNAEENQSAFALSRELTHVMRLDGDAIKNLHLLYGDTGKTTGSLYEFLNHTFTAPGRRRLRQWLLRPLQDVRAIDARLDVVREFSNNHVLLQTFRDRLKHFKWDHERLFAKSCRLAIKCTKVYNIVRFNQTSPLTQEDEMGLRELAPKGATKLEEILIDAVNMISFWEMHKSALVTFVDLVRALIEIRDVVSTLSEIAERNVSVASLHRDVEDAISFLRELRSCLEDRRKENTKNKERYIVPSALVFRDYGEFAAAAERERAQDQIVRKHAQRQRRELLRNIYIPLSDDDERDDEEQDAADRADLAAANAFTEVMHAFYEEIPRFERVVSAMADLDVLQSFATSCASSRGAVGFTRPRFTTDTSSSTLELVCSWHPLLKPSMVDDAKRITHNSGIVDNDVSMKTPFVLLTGPNMSGKSSILRQVAIIVIMAQIGCYVPAASCEISVADAVMTRLGGDDNFANGVSTFLNEMKSTAKIMNDVTSSTLVILDELGRGTSTLDGYSIAFATSLELCSCAQAPRVLFATHYHELDKDLARQEIARGKFVTKHIDVSSTRSGALKMTYKLKNGPAPLGSCALNVARLAGFPPGILTRASHVSQTVTFKGRVKDSGFSRSSYVPPKALLSNEEHLMLSALLGDPALTGDADRLGDGVEWCRRFHALWRKCNDLSNRANEP